MSAIPMLPDDIADMLDDATPASDAANDATVTAFIEQHTTASRSEILAGWKSALRNHFAESSRHNGAVSVLTGALKEARAGYFPAAAAVDVLRPMFIAAATREPTGAERRRTHREAEDEWAGIMAWAVAQATPPTWTRCMPAPRRRCPRTHLTSRGWRTRGISAWPSSWAGSFGTS